MFTAQEVLDIAIRLENNGERTYLEARQHATRADLKALLAWVAQEEQNHARWFTGLKESLAQGEDHHLMTEMSRALVEDIVRGQTFSLQEVNFEAIDTHSKMIRTFIGFENDTVAFYEVLKTFIDDPVTLKQLEQIIAEEKKHIERFREMLSAS